MDLIDLTTAKRAGGTPFDPAHGKFHGGERWAVSVREGSYPNGLSSGTGVYPVRRTDGTVAVLYADSYCGAVAFSAVPWYMTQRADQIQTLLDLCRKHECSVEVDGRGSLWIAELEATLARMAETPTCFAEPLAWSHETDVEKRENAIAWQRAKLVEILAMEEGARKRGLVKGTEARIAKLSRVWPPSPTQQEARCIAMARSRALGARGRWTP